MTASRSFNLHALAAAVAAMFSFAGAARAASVYDDNFDDGVTASQWTTLTQPGLSISETGGHLNVLSAPSTDSHADALYLSTFKLSTASSFSVSADYSFADFTVPNPPQPGGTAPLRAMVVDLGVGMDVAGHNSAAIGQGFSSIRNPLTGVISTSSLESAAYRTANVQTSLSPTLPPRPGATSGTFDISYDSPSDTLTLSEVGGASYTLANTVRGIWGASDLYVSLGGRGDSEFTTAPGQSYLDNFVVIVPEPTSLAMVIAAAGLLRRRRGLA